MKINKKKEHIYYLSSIMAGACIVFVLFFIPYSFFKKNHENLSISKLVDYQISKKNIYSSPINIDYTNYSLIKYSKLKPEILIIGTSTSQHVSDNFYGKNVLKLNNNFYNLDMTEKFLKKIIKIHKPKIILYGLDWWVLNKNWVKKNNFKIMDNKNPNLNKEKSILQYSASNYLSFYKWILSKKINYKKLFSEKKNIGILANENFEGFTLWGNYIPARILLDSEHINIDKKFQNSLERLNNKVWNFEKFTIDNNLIKKLTNIENLIVKENIKFIKFYPPISPKFYNIFISQRDDFERLDISLDSTNILNFRYSDYYNDCMFIDGIHAGETLMTFLVAQILLEEKLINHNSFDEIKKLFQSNRRNAYFSETIYPLKELDFLELGCKDEF